MQVDTFPSQKKVKTASQESQIPFVTWSPLLHSSPININSTTKQHFVPINCQTSAHTSGRFSRFFTKPISIRHIRFVHLFFSLLLRDDKKLFGSELFSFFTSPCFLSAMITTEAGEKWNPVGSLINVCARESQRIVNRSKARMKKTLNDSAIDPKTTGDVCRFRENKKNFPLNANARATSSLDFLSLFIFSVRDFFPHSFFFENTSPTAFFSSLFLPPYR
jgi:hypothetical protein